MELGRRLERGRLGWLWRRIERRRRSQRQLVSSRVKGESMNHYFDELVSSLQSAQDGNLVSVIVYGWGVVAPGNPKRLARGADLARSEIALVNREPGAGSRLVLEEALRADGVPEAAVPGFQSVVCSHAAVAEALSCAKDMVSKGKKISIVNTAAGEPIGVNELQEEVRRTKRQ